MVEIHARETLGLAEFKKWAAYRVTIIGTVLSI